MAAKDIEVDILSPSHSVYVNSRHMTGGYSQDNVTFSGENSRQMFHPSDSIAQNHRTTVGWTSANSVNVPWNSTNNVIQQNPIHSENNCFYKSNVSNPYNFSNWNSSVAESTQNSINFSYANGSNSYNTSISDSSGIPDISRLSMNEADSSLVFYRPPTESNNVESRLFELQNSKYPNYGTQAQRIQSYACSIVPVRSPQDMSEAGFFAISKFSIKKIIVTTILCIHFLAHLA